MHVRYRNHGHITDEVRKVVEHESRVLDDRLRDINEDLKLLRVNVIHHLRDNTYTAKLVLEVPDHTIPAHGDGRSGGVATRDAFGNLMDEVDEYLAKLRGEPEERLEGKFHISAQELHRAALAEIESSAPPEPQADKGASR